MKKSVLLITLLVALCCIAPHKVSAGGYELPGEETGIHEYTEEDIQKINDQYEASVSQTKKLPPDLTTPSLTKDEEAFRQAVKDVLSFEDLPEDLIEDVGVLLINPDPVDMPSETRSLLRRIPADSLPTRSRVLKPKFSVEILHSPLQESVNPFPELDPAEQDPSLRPEIELSLSVRDKPANAIEYLYVAYDALTVGQLESATAYYKKVLLQHPENQDALFGLAVSYHKGGQLEQAREAYIELIQLNRTHRKALSNFIMLAAQEAPEAALLELKELEKSNPEFSPIPAQIAMIYIEKRDFKMAAKHLTRAAILEPENLEYRYNLALVMEIMGSKNVAARLYYQILNAGRRGVKIPVSEDTLQQNLSMLSK